jgi:hypothetical protein
MASVLLARDILGSRSDRFRRIGSLRNRFMFERAVRVCLHLNETETALSLLELLNTGARALERQEPTGDAPDADALSRIGEEGIALCMEAEKAVSDGTSEHLSSLQDRADLLLAERDLLGVSLRKKEDGNDAGQSTETLEGIRSRIASVLPHDAILLEYTLVAGELWIVAATDATTFLHHTALGPFELEMLKRSVAYESESLLQPVALNVLQEELLRPVGRLLSQKKRVVIALADVAYGIPFHAMRWTGGVLIDTHDVQYLVGGVTVRSGVRSARPEPKDGVLCRFIGAPSVSYTKVIALPAVEKEREVVEDLIPEQRRCIPFPASSRDLLNGAQAEVLHVACHGLYEKRAPLMSRLLLADRPVFAFEIALSHFQTDLAIIAGCQTATASGATGGYVQSLATAFQRAGVKTVIASLWPVDDESSAELMRHVYQNLQGGRRSSTVAAFCAAQRALRKREEFEPSWYWAPFVIFEELAS